jgi:tRNA threonylcarbamoyladenosine biosynthesis protein TsaE
MAGWARYTLPMSEPLPYSGECFLADELATVVLGERLARAVLSPSVVYLRGQLGAGKTTLSRGFLRGRGHRGSVKSPTYTLVEPYEGLPDGSVYHLDLYRLGASDELQYLGLDDYLADNAVMLIEWPERAEAALPAADVEVCLMPSAEGRLVRLHVADERLLDCLEA